MQKKKIKILFVELWGASDPLTFSRPRRVTEEKMISLTIPHNSFVLLLERGMVRLKCFAQEHNTLTRQDMEPRTLDPEPPNGIMVREE